MSTANSERRRLAGRLTTFDPHHLRSRHHDLARRSVAEFEYRLDHPTLVVGHDTTLLSQIHHFAKFDLGGERPITETAARGHRVAQQHQQPADRGQQNGDELQRQRSEQRDRVGVLPAEGARTDSHHDEVDHGHDRRRRDQPPGHTEIVGDIGHEQDGGANFAGNPKQHNKIDVARPIAKHTGQARGARPLVANQFLQAGNGHRVDSGVDRGEQSAGGDECEQTDKRCQTGHDWSKYRDLSSSRRSFSFWRSWW